MVLQTQIYIVPDPQTQSWAQKGRCGQKPNWSQQPSRGSLECRLILPPCGETSVLKMSVVALIRRFVLCFKLNEDLNVTNNNKSKVFMLIFTTHVSPHVGVDNKVVCVQLDKMSEKCLSLYF